MLGSPVNGLIPLIFPVRPLKPPLREPIPLDAIPKKGLINPSIIDSGLNPFIKPPIPVEPNPLVLSYAAAPNLLLGLFLAARAAAISA